MSTLSYEESKKEAWGGFWLLLGITLIEVAIALVGNGHIGGMHWSKWIMYPLMIGFSMYKAYFIVGTFMHMKYEVKGLAMTVVLPTLLLVWAIIAFLQEGGAWRGSRERIYKFNSIPGKAAPVEAVPAAVATDTVKVDTSATKIK